MDKFDNLLIDLDLFKETEEDHELEPTMGELGNELEEMMDEWGYTYEKEVRTNRMDNSEYLIYLVKVGEHTVEVEYRYEKGVEDRLERTGKRLKVVINGNSLQRMTQYYTSNVELKDSKVDVMEVLTMVDVSPRYIEELERVTKTLIRLVDNSYTKEVSDGYLWLHQNEETDFTIRYSRSYKEKDVVYIEDRELEYTLTDNLLEVFGKDFRTPSKKVKDTPLEEVKNELTNGAEVVIHRVMSNRESHEVYQDIVFNVHGNEEEGELYLVQLSTGSKKVVIENMTLKSREEYIGHTYEDREGLIKDQIEQKVQEMTKHQTVA